MPTSHMLGIGWELHIRRLSVQVLKTPGHTRTRTIAEYQVYHDGSRVLALAGTIAEQKGPSDNTLNGGKYDRRIEGGRYPLWTQYGTKYRTIGYIKSKKAEADFSVKPRPGIELIGTGKRSEILIHPAVGFLSSEGCIHPCSALPKASSAINFPDSRRRVIELIDDIRLYTGLDFPKSDGHRIPNAWAAIDEIK